jgi:precorrin-2 dehydrogenase / sirohydrochlorin ferrochelatase
MSRYYPIYMSLAGRVCLVVGGGSVAERKVQGLLEAGARVHVVSPEVTPTLRQLGAAGEIEIVLGRYEAHCLAEAALAFAATNVREVNAQVASDARARGIPVNVADAPEEGDFIVPSVVRRGDFCLSISTGGNHPLLAARLGAEMEARFGPEYGEFVELLGQMRDYIKEKTPSLPLRREALARLLEYEEELRALLRENKSEQALERAKEVTEFQGSWVPKILVQP